MHNEVWVCGFILLFLFMGFATFCTIHWCKSFVATFSCLLCHFGALFGTQFRKSVEFWKKRCMLGYIWIASIVRVIREWFPLNRLQIFTIAPIVRIELEAIVIVPIVRVVLVMSVVFPYDEQATQVPFDYSE